MIGAPFLLLRQPFLPPSFAFGPLAHSLTHSSKLRVGDELANIFAFADLIVIIAAAAPPFLCSRLVGKGRMEYALQVERSLGSCWKAVARSRA